MPLFSVCLCAAAATACGTESAGGTVGPVGTVAIVTYSATSTGDATFTSVTYPDEAGDPVTETGVGPQWSKTVSVPSGSQVALAADVTVVSNGSAEIRMSIARGAARFVDSATRSAAKGVSFTLSIPAVTLP